jgi:anaerobic selenocysteine-containing dehydrogenase
MPLQLTATEATKESMLVRLAPTSLYHVDGITRRAHSLAQAQDADVAKVIIHSDDANRLGLQIGQKVWVIQEGNQSTTPLPIEIDERIPVGVAMVASSIKETQTLGAPFGLIELKPS